jgi:GNAT superfamily N-acetyltransferase
VLVRPAAPDDAEAVLAVSMESQAMHAEALPGAFRPADAALLRPVVETRLAPTGGDDRLAFVAVVGGEVVGHVHAEIERRDPSPFKTGGVRMYVHELGVLAAHRGTGLGVRLMEAVHAAAAARGIGEVALHVYSFNAGARALYERLGYRPLQELLVLDGDAAGAPRVE